MRALDQLVAMKGNFEKDAGRRTVELLKRLHTERIRDAADLIHLHETVLFLRAYPQNVQVLRLADRLLFSFEARMQGRPDLDPFEEPEISGISGTSFATTFSHEFASALVARHGREISIDWDAYDRPDRLGPVLAGLVPGAYEDWSVEPHIDWRGWFDAGRCTLSWLLAHTDPRVYDSLEIPLRWKLHRSSAARSRTRLPAKKIFYHGGPFLKRSDVSIESEFRAPAIKVKRVRPAEARRIFETILDTSAVRYRELWGFSHPDFSYFYQTSFGRGVDFYFFGIPKEWRLPFRAYHCGMYFKNGVPLGYFEGLSFFERMEMGFNLYYTFREGETAWLYARTLKLFRERLGIGCFSIDPYQLGHENEEAIASGAYWFYRKLGFRPVTDELVKLSAKEEEKIHTVEGYRTPAATLRRLARMPMVFGEGREWGHFSLRKLAQKIAGGKVEIPEFRSKEILRAKNAPEEVEYLRLLQRMPELRRRVLREGRI